MQLPNFVAIDTESNGINVWRGARMFSASACFADGRTLFWRDEFSGLRELLDDPTIHKVFHNEKHDLRILEYSGFKVRGPCWDSMVMCHLMDGRKAGKQLALEHASARYLPADMRKVVTEVDQWFDSQRIAEDDRGSSFHLLPPDLLRRRNVGDAALTAGLFKRLYRTCMYTFPFLMELEHELLYVVKDMEERGVLVDPDEIEIQRQYFDSIVEDVLRFCEGVVGDDFFNINSRAHQEEMLQKAGILHLIKERTNPSKSFPKGQISLKDQSLRQLHHPVAHMLLLGKAASKMSNTFLDQMARYHIECVLRANYNQLGTNSGRFSCSGPNLQNIPIEGDRRTSYTAEEAAESFEMTGVQYAPHLKRCFRCRPGFAHIHSDKKQAELVYLGHYSEDKNLCDIIRRGDGIHEGVCNLLYGELTKGLKTRTKAVVFGFCYGAGDPTLAVKIGSTVDEARRTRKRMEQMLPGLPKWKSRLEGLVKAQHYVETIHGRRHYLYDSQSYIAVNRMCQGSVGDEMKSRMVALYKWKQKHLPEMNITMNIHDDLCNEVPIEAVPDATPHIHRIMEETSKELIVPARSSLDITYTRWSDLQEITDVNNVPKPTQSDLDRWHRSVRTPTRSISMFTRRKTVTCSVS